MVSTDDSVMAQLRTARIAAGMTQADAAVATDQPLHCFATAEADDANAFLSQLVTYAHVLGCRVTLRTDGGGTTDLGVPVPRPEKLPPITQRRSSNLLACVRQLAAGLSPGRRLRHVAVVDAGYLGQLEQQVWRRRLSPHDAWQHLPGVDGLAVSTAADLGDEIQLVANPARATLSNTTAVRTLILAPDGLDDEEITCYQTLRADGTDPDTAAELVTVLRQHA